MASNDTSQRAHPIHPELQRLLDRHRADTPKHKRQVHDQLSPIIRAVSASLLHLSQLEADLNDAIVATHDAGFNHSMKWLEDEISAVRHRGELARVGLKDFARALENFETSLTRPMASILRDMGAS